jgi:hypothetical protein
MTSCIGEPVSYFRLERFALRELSADEQRSVAEHLAQCPTCRACHDRIQADGREQDLAALVARLQAPRGPQPRAAGRARGWLWGTVALSLTGLLAVLSTQPGTQPMAPGGTPGTKGDGLALELTRIDDRGQQLEPTRFAPSDRFRVALSCPPALAGKVHVLAFQAGEKFEPLPAQTLASCGNRRMLSGAFRLDGSAPVDVCVLLGDADVTAVRARDGLPEPHVCARIEPVAGER